MNLGSVLVTGAASGIGRATTLLWLARGGAVAALDRDDGGLQMLVDDAAGLGRRDRLVPIACDVTSTSDLEHAFTRAGELLGPVRGVVANAGIEVNTPLHDLCDDDWERVLRTNLGGAFRTCQVALNTMIAAGLRASIVCVSSPAAFVGFAGGGNGAYAASKGGVSALVRSMAIDYAARGIRVNAVVPGATDTPMLLAGVPAQDRDAARADILSRAAREVPLGRLAEPVEIAQAVVWLLSDDSSYVTGSHLVCDGGLLAKSANTI